VKLPLLSKLRSDAVSLDSGSTRDVGGVVWEKQRVKKLPGEEKDQDE
jgi:hypothetical protein